MKRGNLTDNLIRNIQYLMKESNLNLQELANLTKIPMSTLYSIINGSSNDPKLSTLLGISTFFNINLSQLIGELSLNLNEINIPIVSWENINPKTGIVEINIDFHTKFISVEAIAKNPMFAIYSSNKFSYRYKEDSLIIIEMTDEFKHLDIILLSINKTEPVFKKIIVEGPSVYLQSLSIDIPIIVFDQATCKIFGVVREIRATA